MPTKIIIVNAKDKVISYKERSDLDYSNDIYRVSALWITNSEGQILLARRAYTKKQNPGKWGPAVAGTVEENETYDSNIIKESQEELGLNLEKNSLKKWIKNNTIGQEFQHFTQIYSIEINQSIDFFKIQEEEVAEIKWFKIEELKKLADEDSDELLEFVKNFVNDNL